MSDVFVGIWYYDTLNSSPETISKWRVAITDDNGVAWGTAVSTGWTPKLQVKVRGGSTVTAEVTGTWEDATEAAALFDLGGATALVPAAGADPIDYQAIIVLSKAGSESIQPAGPNGDLYFFRMARWP